MTPWGHRRLDAIAALCPRDAAIVDVGADHGALATRVGALAVEREPQRMAGPAPAWLICDGLRALREVPTAVIAGMGARTITAILDAGPRPDVLVAHADDEPGALRTWLARRGWRVDAERFLVDPNRPARTAQVVRFVHGDEAATGHTLWYGPTLLASRPPGFEAHLMHQRVFWARVAAQAAPSAPDRAAEALAHVHFLDSTLHGR